MRNRRKDESRTSLKRNEATPRDSSLIRSVDMTVTTWGIVLLSPTPLLLGWVGYKVTHNKVVAWVLGTSTAVVGVHLYQRRNEILKATGDLHSSIEGIRAAVASVVEAAGDQWKPRHPIALSVFLLGKYDGALRGPGLPRPARQLPAPSAAAAACREQHLRELQHFMKFAGAMYGSLLMTSTGIITPAQLVSASVEGAASVDQKAFCVHTGVRPEDILLWDQEGQEVGDGYHPTYSVSVDHSQRSIVIAIRGTVTLQDVITDLMYEYAPFLGGIAHGGIAKAARKLLDLTIGAVRALVAQYPSYCVSVCGHSLGGAAAILYAALLINCQSPHASSQEAAEPERGCSGAGEQPRPAGEVGSSPAEDASRSSEDASATWRPRRATLWAPPDTSSPPTPSAGHSEVEGGRSCQLPHGTVVKCYAFGAPPVFAPLEALPAALHENLVCAVNEADVVPHLSVSNVYKLLLQLRKVDEMPMSGPARWRLLGSRWWQMRAQKQQLRAALQSVESDTDILHDINTRYPALYTPGQIYWITQPPRQWIRAVPVEAPVFNRLAMADLPAFADHFISRYTTALERVVDRLSQPQPFSLKAFRSVVKKRKLKRPPPAQSDASI